MDKVLTSLSIARPPSWRYSEEGEVKMYTLIKGIGPRQLLLEQVPALSGALVVAELLYKFHSFTLTIV